MFVDKIKERNRSEIYVIMLGTKGIAIRSSNYHDLTSYIYDYDGQLLSRIPFTNKLKYIYCDMDTTEVVPNYRRMNYEYWWCTFPEKSIEICPRYLFYYNDEKDQKIEKLAYQFRYSGSFQRFWIMDIGFNYLNGCQNLPDG